MGNKVKKAEKATFKKGINTKDRVDRHLELQPIPKDLPPKKTSLRSLKTGEQKFQWTKGQQLCLKVYKPGGCPKKQTCRFAHSKGQQDQASFQDLKKHFGFTYKDRTKVCPDEYTYNCSKGVYCFYTHQDEPWGTYCEIEKLHNDCCFQREGTCPFLHKFAVRRI